MHHSQGVHRPGRVDGHFEGQNFETERVGVGRRERWRKSGEDKARRTIMGRERENQKRVKERQGGDLENEGDRTKQHYRSTAKTRKRRKNKKIGQEKKRN